MNVNSAAGVHSCQDELEKSIGAYVTFELSDLYI